MHIPPHELRRYAELVNAALTVHRDLAELHARAARDHGRLAVVLTDIVTLLRTGSLQAPADLSVDLRLVEERREEFLDAHREGTGDPKEG